jgi:hypothetical protein
MKRCADFLIRLEGKLLAQKCFNSATERFNYILYQRIYYNFHTHFDFDWNFAGKMGELYLRTKCILCVYQNVTLSAVGTRCADHGTPLFPQKLAMIS